jgi:hypothetical protein
MHLRPICTWDQKVKILKSVTVRHLGPWRTWDMYALETMTDLGLIWRTWDQYALGTMTDLGPIWRTWDQYELGTRPRHPLAWLDWLGLAESSQAKPERFWLESSQVKPDNPWLDNQIKFICLEIFWLLIQNRQKWRLRAKFWKLRLIIRYYLLFKVATSKPDNFVSKLNGTLNQKNVQNLEFAPLIFY